jgi:cell division protein FtsQ
MQAIAKPLDMKVTELRLSERYAWTLVLDNAIRVNLGRGEFVDRLQRFIDLFPLIDEDPRVLNYVDLRYDTGLAIGWLETEQPES